jgi:ABC-type transport system substrate-binding protein
MKKILFFVLTIIILGGMLLVSCGKQAASPTPTPTPTKTQTPTPTPTQTPTPTANMTAAAMRTIANEVEALEVPGPDPNGKFGGRLHLVGPMNIANMGDPAQNSNPTDASYTAVACEPLLRYDGDGNLVPWLAWKFEIADDGSAITFYLRKGIMFQDGTPFNAEAVKYCLDIQLAPTAVWPDLKVCDKCEVLDEYTVRLHFKDGKLNWPAVKALAGGFSGLMFSPTYLKNNTPEYKRLHMVGTGPFKLSEFKRDEYVKFDRYDDYWRGKPFLDGIDYKIISDMNTQLIAYRSGEIDTLGVQAKDRAALEADGFTVTEMPQIFVSNLALLPSSADPNSPLADIRVRRACEYAINKQELVDTIGYGLGIVANQLYPESDPCHNPDTVGYPYDPVKAKELLKEAGYGEGLKLKFYQVDFLSMDFPLAIQDMWSQVGIETEIVRLSILQINDMVSGPTAKGWDGWFYSYAVAGPGIDPAQALSYGPISDNLFWISNYEPPDLIELAKEGATELNPEKRVKIYQEISKKMVDDYAQWLFLYYPIGLVSVSPRVKGVDPNQGSQFMYAFAWVED